MTDAGREALSPGNPDNFIIPDLGELFHEIDPLFFGTKETTLFSLLVTLTTANFPEVMMECYNYSPYTVIYFIWFWYIGSKIIYIIYVYIPK